MPYIYFKIDNSKGEYLKIDKSPGKAHNFIQMLHEAEVPYAIVPNKKRCWLPRKFLNIKRYEQYRRSPKGDYYRNGPPDQIGRENGAITSANSSDLKDVEFNIISKVMEQCRTQVEAAKILGISRRVINYKIKLDPRLQTIFNNKMNENFKMRGGIL